MSDKELLLIEALETYIQSYETLSGVGDILLKYKEEITKHSGSTDIEEDLAYTTDILRQLLLVTRVVSVIRHIKEKGL